jgi:hypothetical protein
MDIKIVCGCGQKYIFEVDPDNGLMGASVVCPACGADGTMEANEILTQIFPESPAGPESERVAPASTVVEGGPTRINPPVRLTMAANPPLPTPPPLPAAPVLRPIRPLTVAAPEVEATEEYNLGRGILGAVLGAGLGAGLMYGFFEWAGFRFPLMGTGIGALSGLGARILARGTDTSLGVITAAIALLSTAGTLYLMFGDMAGMFILSMAVSAYFAYIVAG